MEALGYGGQRLGRSGAHELELVPQVLRFLPQLVMGPGGRTLTGGPLGVSSDRFVGGGQASAQQLPVVELACLRPVDGDRSEQVPRPREGPVLPGGRGEKRITLVLELFEKLRPSRVEVGFLPLSAYRSSRLDEHVAVANGSHAPPRISHRAVAAEIGVRGERGPRQLEERTGALDDPPSPVRRPTEVGRLRQIVQGPLDLFVDFPPQTLE